MAALSTAARPANLNASSLEGSRLAYNKSLFTICEAAEVSSQPNARNLTLSSWQWYTAERRREVGAGGRTKCNPGFGDEGSLCEKELAVADALDEIQKEMRRRA
ncbi:hypothetical protein B7463_g7690, partial [Scytalidium lignicola]